MQKSKWFIILLIIILMGICLLCEIQVQKVMKRVCLYFPNGVASK